MTALCFLCDERKLRAVHTALFVLFRGAGVRVLAAFAPYVVACRLIAEICERSIAWKQLALLNRSSVPKRYALHASIVTKSSARCGALHVANGGNHIVNYSHLIQLWRNEIEQRSILAVINWYSRDQFFAFFFNNFFGNERCDRAVCPFLNKLYNFFNFQSLIIFH